LRGQPLGGGELCDGDAASLAVARRPRYHPRMSASKPIPRPGEATRAGRTFFTLPCP
jgi:hypothetical protein